MGQNFAATVSCAKPYAVGVDDLPASHAFAVAPAAPARHRVVAYDCGAKRSILHNLVRTGCELAVVPWDMPAEEVLAMEPDGVFLSNGPGDPEAVEGTYAQVEKLLGRVRMYDFALVEVIEYLDGHPDNAAALKYYNEMRTAFDKAAR